MHVQRLVHKCVFGADGYSEGIVRAGEGFLGGVWKRSKDVTLQLAQDRADGLLTLTALPLCMCGEKPSRLNLIQRRSGFSQEMPKVDHLVAALALLHKTR